MIAVFIVAEGNGGSKVFQIVKGLHQAAAGSAILSVLAWPAAGTAGETSATNFPPGVNTALSALYPPAGATEYYNYMLYYSAGAYPTTSGNPGLPPFHTTVLVEAFRVNHTWINLGPDVTIGSGFTSNFVRQTLTIGSRHVSSGLQYADPDLIPYNIGFHVAPDLWVAHIFNIFTDWGQYSRNNILSEGTGYLTYAPEVAVTYMTPKWEVSLDGHYDFNSRNSSTGYQSGSFGDVDYLVGYRPSASLAGLQIGVCGYGLEQLEDDTKNGHVVGRGNRGQVFGIGPSLRYDIGHGGLILKLQHEAFVENRTKGDRLWFQFALPL
jgi:hypothetical protein